MSDRGGAPGDLPTPLPDFLGIGAPRAGTTWLHEVLDAHPDVLMPSKRKEINFFDLHYDRGLEWYAGCYRLPAHTAPPPRVGEITPVYMYREQCLPRVEEVGTVDRFIVCLRNPVDLLWSGYRQSSARFDFRGDLPEFMEAFPRVVENGFYARALRPWIDRFGIDRFLFVRFDDLAADPVDTRTAVADFLGVDPTRFPPEAGREPVNHAVAPRFRRLFSLAGRAATRLHRADRSRLVDFGKRLGLKRLVSAGAWAGSEPEPASDEVWSALGELYADDLAELERLIGLDIAPWSVAG